MVPIDSDERFQTLMVHGTKSIFRFFVATNGHFVKSLSKYRGRIDVHHSPSSLGRSHLVIATAEFVYNRNPPMRKV